MSDQDSNPKQTGPKICTYYEHPPIPDAHHLDWVAWFDGDEESGPRGHGYTETEAIADLKENADEEAD